LLFFLDTLLIRISQHSCHYCKFRCICSLSVIFRLSLLILTYFCHFSCLFLLLLFQKLVFPLIKLIINIMHFTLHSLLWITFWNLSEKLISESLQSHFLIILARHALRFLSEVCSEVVIVSFDDAVSILVWAFLDRVIIDEIVSNVIYLSFGKDRRWILAILCICLLVTR
jgi:hypothetical protein